MSHTHESLPATAWDGKLVSFVALFDVLGRRWSLRLIWELRRGSATFRELRERAGGISSSVLSDRLRELREAGIVHHERGTGYRLTTMGEGLADRIIEIYGWLRESATASDA